MRKNYLCFLLILLALLTAAGSGAEVKVSAVPGTARAGDVVDVQVKTDGSPACVVYILKNNGETVFSGKEDDHFEASFRPRLEGEYVLEARVIYEDGTTETGTAAVSVSGTRDPEQGSETVYSQKDGWWKTAAYSKSDLEKAGCAIFTLSHALQRMGRTGDDILPEQLAETYRKCYTKNGTANARLIWQAGQVYGYTTANGLYKQKAELRESLRDGDMFSFGIVLGHIALMSGIDEKGDKVLITDSAPSATFERIKKGKIYYLEDGEYKEAREPGEIPGARYYFETGFYGGLEYYMDLEYCARRGGRLIRPAWLFWRSGENATGAEMIQAGAGISIISVNGKQQSVPTRDLLWGGNGKPVLAVVTEKKNILLRNAEGKRAGTVPSCTILPVLEERGEMLYVQYGGQRGYVRKNAVEITEPLQGDIRTGRISVNGNTSGRATVKLRFGPSEKHRVVSSWKTGTEVCVITESGDFLQVEAKGTRVWVHRDYLTPDWEEEEDGTEIGQGE